MTILGHHNPIGFLTHDPEILANILQLNLHGRERFLSEHIDQLRLKLLLDLLLNHLLLPLLLILFLLEPS